MNRILALLLLFCTFLFLTSCDNDKPKQEQPAIYVEDIEVVITKIYKKQWFAGTAQREVEVTVYSEEYDITGKDTIRYTGVFGSMPLWDADEGDIVEARMIVLYMKSTGQITNRYIDKIYS